MKKWICLCLVFCMAFACVACTDNGDKPADVTTAAGTTQPSDTQVDQTIDPVDSVLTLGDMTGVYGTLFGNGRMIDIAITVNADELRAMKAAAQPNAYISASVTVNGNTASNVGLALEDDISLPVLAGNEDAKYSFRICADRFAENQTLCGLDELVLDNFFGDPSYMRAYVYGLTLNEIGGKSPFMAYAKVTVNGEDAGLYLMTEAAADSYAARLGGEIVDVDADDLTDLSRLNTESFIHSFAVDSILANYTGYFDQTAHHYAIIDVNGKYEFVEYNTGLAFGAYYYDSGLSMQQDVFEPAYLCEMEDRPLAYALLEDSDACDLYFDDMVAIVGYMETLEALNEQIEAVIGDAVAADANAFYDAEAHQKNIVFSGVELSDLLGDAGSILVDIGHTLENAMGVVIDPDSKATLQDYAKVKGMADYMHQRITAISGQLAL